MFVSKEVFGGEQVDEGERDGEKDQEQEQEIISNGDSVALPFLKVLTWSSFEEISKQKK